MGCWSFDMETLRRIFTAYSPSDNDSVLRCLLPRYPKRIALLVIGNMVNIALAILGIIYHPNNFASYLLAIFMANLNIYCWFYIIMKLVHRERIPWQPLFYIIISFILWGFSLNYFFHKAISWQQTPALSRTYNHACNVLEFYDYHDIWHFLSAGSMFSSFMVLLTLDDNLIHVPRNEINVF
ncbi:hypothetical protein B566_EDAN000982 [Ephemera danica]|nr:hypothetical protein B566_EDAN000982 [Ephemera danica]